VVDPAPELAGGGRIALLQRVGARTSASIRRTQSSATLEYHGLYALMTIRPDGTYWRTILPLSSFRPLHRLGPAAETT
jgi:hypothetical protein